MIGVDGDHLVMDGAGCVTSEIEVRVVGHVHVGLGIRSTALREREHVVVPVFRECIGYREGPVPGEAKLAVHKRARERDGAGVIVYARIPEPLVKTVLKIGVKVVLLCGPVVSREMVGNAPMGTSARSVLFATGPMVPP